MNHYWVTREVEADERQDLLCDFRPVRKVLPEEVGKQLLLQLAPPCLARFMVCCYLFTTWALETE